MHRLLAACGVFLVTAPPIAAGGAVSDEGRVTAVTVFQGQALVTREVDLPDREGLVELVVGGLPERLLPGSLYAEGPDGVEVRSVRTRVRPTDKSQRAEVQELEKRRAELTRRTQEMLVEQMLLRDRSEYLDSLEQFTAKTGAEELRHGVLNAETLTELTNLLFERREQVANRGLEITAEQNEIDQQLQLIARELATLTRGDDGSRREAVVFLNKDAGAASVRLMYLVGGAGWSPSYNLRASEDGAQVTVEYNASVTQMSGEDWTDVAMTLSTASPSLVAEAPDLAPLRVRLTAPRQEAAETRQSKLDLLRRQKALATNRGNSAFGKQPSDAFYSEAKATGFESQLVNEGVGARDGGLGGGGGFGAVYANSPEAVADTDRTLNRLADRVQLYDYTAPRQTRTRREGPADAESGRTEGVSVVYRLDGKTSLPSRSDNQLIQIASLGLDADTHRVATPVLTQYVYLQADLTNSTDTVLLAGPAATFLGDRFVGRGSVPAVSIGESFTVGLGIDESLRAGRELVDSSERVQGGNRLATLEYQLTLENFGDSETTVCLMDRLPLADGEAIKVTLSEAKPEADDRSKESGVVRWDVKVPANAIGDKFAEVRYAVTIEHDRSLTLTGVEE